MPRIDFRISFGHVLVILGFLGTAGLVDFQVGGWAARIILNQHAERTARIREYHRLHADYQSMKGELRQLDYEYAALVQNQLQWKQPPGSLDPPQ